MYNSRRRAKIGDSADEPELRGRREDLMSTLAFVHWFTILEVREYPATEIHTDVIM
jgi:hypothetical protein